MFIIEVILGGVSKSHTTLDAQSGFVGIDHDGRFVDDPTLARGLVSSHRGSLFAMSVDPEEPAWLEDGALLAGCWTEVVMPFALRIGSAMVAIREVVQPGHAAAEDTPTLRAAQLPPRLDECPSAPWPRSDRMPPVSEATRIREIVVPRASTATSVEEVPPTIRTPFRCADDDDTDETPLVVTRTSRRGSWERVREATSRGPTGAATGSR